MPVVPVTLTVTGATPAEIAQAVFTWRAHVQFNPSTAHCNHGPNRNFDMIAEGQQTGGATIRIQLQRIVGGDLSIDVSTNITGRPASARLTGLTIVGTNPTRAAVQAHIGDDVLKRIACHESGQRQFDAAPGATAQCPLWSGDNQGGVGLFQITVPTPSEAQVWDWTANVAAGRAHLAQGRQSANNYRTRIQNSHTFANMVTQINNDRAAHGLPAITVTVPAFTAAQTEDDAIRAFNGYGGRHDQFGFPLHEFRLAMDGARLRVQINEATRTGTPEWERVPVADRGPAGDPNYVNNVRAANPACGG